MIDYFYGFDYKDEPKPKGKLKHSTEINVAVYAIADKYEIVDLKSLAIKKFGLAIGNFITKKQDPLEVIRAVYETTPPNERGLRDVCVDIWTMGVINVKDPESKSRAQRLFEDMPQFATDIAFKLASNTSTTRMEMACSCHPTGHRHDYVKPEVTKALEHKWKDQSVLSFNVAFTVPQFWKTA